MIVAACLSGVALLGTWGSVQQAPPYAGGLVREQAMRESSGPDVSREVQTTSAHTQTASALGAVVGTMLAAWLADRTNRRVTYFVLCLGSLVVVPAFYLTQTSVTTMFFALAFLMGGITASFYGWLPLYLPENFRTAVRATGQGFAFNFGRILAAIGVLQLGNLTALFRGGLPVACASLSAVYVNGMPQALLADRHSDGRGGSLPRPCPAIRISTADDARPLAVHLPKAKRMARFFQSGKQTRPKTALKGKRYRCARCRKRSPRPV